MSDGEESTPTSRAITRRDLELVIRRAVELATEQADSGDAISEEEVVRIAGEVGLSASYVRQALFDLPALQEAERPTLAARSFGPSAVVARRVVPGQPDVLLRRLEDYLSTREYLQLRRHQPGRALFVPAEDPVSAIARALLRPKRRFLLARASRVAVTVEAVEAGSATVRLDLDLADQRRAEFTGGGVLGTFIGMVLGGGLGTAGALAALALVGGPVAAAAGAVAGGVLGLAAGIAVGLRLARGRFHRRLWEASAELEGLLDRLQSGDRLEPPPSPLLRRLRERFIGPGPVR